MFWLVGRFLCRTAWAGVCPNQLVQAGNGNQLIPIHPVDAADVLIARAAEAPAEEEVVLSTVQAVPSIGGELVDELAVVARLRAFKPAWMKPSVAHQPWPLSTIQPSMEFELLPITTRQAAVDGDPLGLVVTWADEPPVLTTPP